VPTIFDNIENKLEKGLLDTLESSCRADFCVGYFNPRGWKLLGKHIEHFPSSEGGCRLLIGMQRPNEDLLRQTISHISEGPLDNPRALALKKEVARSFRKQLTFGIPTAKDEENLRFLRDQLSSGKVQIKLFLNYPLHAKLYLLHRKDKMAPVIAYVGSSNLTASGLSVQGELNVDVLEQDAAKKLGKWFEDRWNDRWALDISSELTQIINESWAGETLIPPYFVYLKIAYHLSNEARTGINNFVIPEILQSQLLPFQANAVSIAARHLEKRNGVLIGDVVGLGKTLTATAVAKLSEEYFFTDTLIICPKNLTAMWEDHASRYKLRAKVISISKIGKDFSENTRRYRVVIIDESHNLRNRHGKRYALVKEYIEKHECKVILLTATPYNKSYLDISSQFRLFIPEDQDLGITPEKFISEAGGPLAFIARYQYSPGTLLAFEKSTHHEDWQELLKMYMVRRTRTFIKSNYAVWDPVKQQHYLTFSNGKINYFPHRVPRRVEYGFDESDSADIYVKLYSDETVTLINSLHLSRYGLGNFIDDSKINEAGSEEKKIIENLSRAGKRLMGFTRTNLYKRLESSGFSFLISVARQALRNCIFIHAIEANDLLPIGQQEAAEMDEFIEENEDQNESGQLTLLSNVKDLKEMAQQYYQKFGAEEKKFKWISSRLFRKDLLKELQEDTDALLKILETGKKWKSADDKKLKALKDLCTEHHSKEKLLVFTQFADTARYLCEELGKENIKALACVTGDTENPTELAQLFSPKSNNIQSANNEIRVLISTDVLSEGQNLQDAHIIVNYDLPWALIRLIQRAGRVDRIGQASSEILCYSFLPHDGLNRILRLRERLKTRITENSEVVGSDEVFFDGDPVNIKDLYNEKAGILDDDEGEVDLTSQAYEIWNQATKANPGLKAKVTALPDVVYSTRQNFSEIHRDSVIAYHRNSQGFELLTWLDQKGNVISQSQSRILKAAECSLNTSSLEKLEDHHLLVKKAVELGEKEATRTGGQLGSKSGARYKAYMILNRYHESMKSTLFDTGALKRAVDDIYHYPLRETARELLNRKLKSDISDEDLAALAIQMREEGKLSVIESDEKNLKEPTIICSMGIRTI
jgi:superfamily II DNA or RNA helicase